MAKIHNWLEKDEVADFAVHLILGRKKNKGGSSKEGRYDARQARPRLLDAVYIQNGRIYFIPKMAPILAKGHALPLNLFI